MLQDVCLGPNLRRQIERQGTSLCAVLLAEERRMAGELITHAFGAKADPKIYTFELPADMDAAAVKTLQIDILRTNRQRFLEFSLQDESGWALYDNQFPLDELGNFERFFSDYWLGASQSLFAPPQTSVHLLQTFDMSRRASHEVCTKLFKAITREMDITLSDRFSKDLFEFVAHLWPHKDNPFTYCFAQGLGSHYNLDQHYA